MTELTVALHLVPTLRVGMHPGTLRVPRSAPCPSGRDRQ